MEIVGCEVDEAGKKPIGFRQWVVHCENEVKALKGAELRHMTRFDVSIINRAVPLPELPLSDNIREKILRICRDYIDNSRNSDKIGIFRRTAYDIGTASSGIHAPDHKFQRAIE